MNVWPLSFLSTTYPLSHLWTTGGLRKTPVHSYSCESNLLGIDVLFAFVTLPASVHHRVITLAELKLNSRISVLSSYITQLTVNT